jgi:hypothetical protein
MRVKEKDDARIVIEATEEEFAETDYVFERMDADPHRIVFRKIKGDDVTHKNILVLDQSQFTDVDRVRNPHDVEQAVVDFMQSSLKEHAPNLDL